MPVFGLARRTLTKDGAREKKIIYHKVFITEINLNEYNK